MNEEIRQLQTRIKALENDKIVLEMKIENL